MVQIGPSIRNRTITTSKEQMKIYIGFDSTCKIASDVCEYSLRRHSDNLDICLLEINELKTTQASAVLLPDDEELMAIADSNGLAWAIFKNPR